MKINIQKLLASLAIPLVAGAVSTFFTFQSINSWYMFLVKPALNPPNWVFGPVWTFLYILIGVSLYLFWNTRSKASHKNNLENNTQKNYGFVFFSLQIIANFLWSILFFALHSPLAGLIDIIILILLIVANIIYFYKINRTSGLLLFPYLIWVMFATYLNISIFLLN